MSGSLKGGLPHAPWGLTAMDEQKLYQPLYRPCVGVVDSGLSAAWVAPGVPGRVRALRAFWPDGEGRAAHGQGVSDCLGHGSAVVDIVARLAPEATFCVAQVFHQRFTTTAAQVAAAIDWLVMQAVDVINLSLGLPGDRAVLAQACERALAAGVVLSAATPARGAAVYPAAYPGVWRMTGDARCVCIEEYAWLAGEQADFGACVRPPAGARTGAGASMGCAHMTGHVVRTLSEHERMHPERLYALLRAGACHAGPERRGPNAGAVSTGGGRA